MDTDENDPVAPVAQILPKNDLNPLAETTQTEISPTSVILSSQQMVESDSANSVLRNLIGPNVDGENGK